MNQDRHHCRGQDGRNRSVDTDNIPSWHPHHGQRNIPKSPRTWHDITPTGYSPGSPSADNKRRAQPPPQLPQPPPPSSPPLYPCLHPPPPHPPVITWHEILSECDEKHCSANLNCGETCWEHPKSTGSRVVSRPPAAHDADSKRGTSPGKPRPAAILSENGMERDISIDASRRCRRRDNTAAVNPADDTLQSQAAMLGNNGSDHPHRGLSPCYATGKLRRHDKITRPDANTQQDAWCPEPCPASFTHRASAPLTKRPHDPFAMVGGCGKGGDLRWQTPSEHVKRYVGSKHQTHGRETPLVASPHDEQTEPTTRRPPCQLQCTGKNSSVSSGSPSRRGSCIADCLLLAEHWLAESKKERLQSRTDAPGQRTSPLKVARSLGGSALGQSTTSRRDQGRLHEREPRGTTARLRGKAAAEWAAGESRRKDEEQMTGTPEITRLGRSKRRSVDDLFLFKRTVDTARRQNQDHRVAQEEKNITARPVSKKSSSFLHSEL